MKLTRRALWRLLAAAPATAVMARPTTTLSAARPTASDYTIKVESEVIGIRSEIQDDADYVLAEVCRKMAAPAAYCPAFQKEGARKGHVVNLAAWGSIKRTHSALTVWGLGEYEPWGVEPSLFRFEPSLDAPYLGGRPFLFTRQRNAGASMPWGDFRFLPREVFRKVYLMPVAEHLAACLLDRPILSADLPLPEGVERTIARNRQLSIRAIQGYEVTTDRLIYRFDVLFGRLDAYEPVESDQNLLFCATPDREVLCQYYDEVVASASRSSRSSRS